MRNKNTIFMAVMTRKKYCIYIKYLLSCKDKKQNIAYMWSSVDVCWGSNLKKISRPADCRRTGPSPSWQCQSKYDSVNQDDLVNQEEHLPAQAKWCTFFWTSILYTWQLWAMSMFHAQKPTCAGDISGIVMMLKVKSKWLWDNRPQISVLQGLLHW